MRYPSRHEINDGIEESCEGEGEGHKVGFFFELEVVGGSGPGGGDD